MLQTTVTHPVPAPPRVARADGKTGRFYTITNADGTSVKYPSVTTILSAAIAKPALIAWSANQERAMVSEAAAELYAELHDKQQLPQSMYLLALEQRLGKVKAHTKALAKAGEIGTAAHAWVEWFLKRELGQRVGPEPQLSDEAMSAAVAFDDFRKEVSLRPRFIEQTVFSRIHQYAGTMDLLADLNAPALLGVLERQGPVDRDLAAWLTARTTVTALVDLKTSKALYAENSLQVAAYITALIEMGHGRPDGGLIVRLPKLTSDPAFEVAVVPNARKLMPTFLAARALWEWQFEHEQLYRQRTGRVA
jgi:hypothetical protein